MTAREAVRRVDAAPPGTRARRFTLRDDDTRHYHRAVRVVESPYYVALAWRADTEAPVHALGTFRLDLRAALEAGYVRPDRPGDRDVVRVRLHRAADGGIYLQPRLNAAGAWIARAPSTRLWSNERRWSAVKPARWAAVPRTCRRGPWR